MKVGFGAYRISNRSKEHRMALELALKEGCSLIDTSSNYTDGESEALIGEVLKANPQCKPLVISKVGYIQGKNIDVLKELHDAGKAKEDVVVFDEHLSHSIHPDFIRDQIKRSLERLKLKSLDAYLLHNPEYYLKKSDSRKEEYYRRIERAFQCLEELVSEGKIKAYGISSNTFILPRAEHQNTDLEKVYEIAEAVKKNHHFKYIQFPLNLLELGALEREYNGLNLIEKAHEFNLITIANRPLNALTSQGLLRLANYATDKKLNDKFAEESFVKLIQPLQQKWDEHEEDESLFSLPLMQQISTLWYKQASEDAVQQIFFGHLFPFIARVWGRDLEAKESQSFYDLYELALEYARKNMNERAEAFKQQAINSGLLFESNENLSKMAVRKYATMGLDYLLLGLKKASYVDEMKEFF